MTDSSDPKAPKNSRKKSAREPATIDLKATVIDDGAAQDKAWDAVKPEETIMPDAETKAEAEDTIGASEATLDSGASTDSIESASASDGLPPQPEELPPRSDEPYVAPSAPTPERRPSAAALVGSGLLGGLVGAGLVYGLQVWQQQQPASTQGDQRLAQLEQRVNALGRQGSQSAPGVDLSSIEGRLNALEAARGPLDQRLEEIQNAANAAASRAEEALNRPLPQPEAPQNEGALNDLSATVNELSGRLAALENEVRTNAQNAASASSAVQGLESRLGEQGERLAALAQQITENSRNVEEAGQTGTRVVLTERLNDSLRSGAPYADVLEALRKAGTDGERLKALEPFAEKGAPTASAMLESFEPLEAQILRDQRAASGEWSDRMLRMLDKVVTVRPVNEPDATGVPGAVARIRQTLGAGDLTGAAAAWASLPEPARRISEDWGRQVTALAGAREAARELSTEALAALNRSTQ